jgi:hypothetical protein
MRRYSWDDTTRKLLKQPATSFQGGHYRASPQINADVSVSKLQCRPGKPSSSLYCVMPVRQGGIPYGSKSLVLNAPA